MASEPLPSDFLPFGRVVGRAISAVGDTDADPDSDPEAIPVTGTGLVRFTPLELTRVVTSTVPSTWVQQKTIAADLDSDGFLSLSGARGLLLWPGAWKVSAGSASEFPFPAFTIEVTAAHTADNPLDLWTAAPYSPPSGTTVTTLVVPAGQQPGQTLGWDGSQLAWVTPKITPTATTLAAGSNATATMSGSWPNLTLGLGIPAGQVGQPSTYQIVGAGRPDIPASMTTAVQAQVSAAPVGSTFSSTDGAFVGAWQWQKLPTGWRVTFGDTGWCEIGPLLTASVTSVKSFRISRTTDSLGIQSKGLVTASGVGFYAFPTGFRATAILFQPLTTDKPGSMLGISDSLWASSAFSQQAAAYQDLAAKCVDPWPTALPGTPS